LKFESAHFRNNFVSTIFTRALTASRSKIRRPKPSPFASAVHFLGGGRCTGDAGSAFLFRFEYGNPERALSDPESARAIVAAAILGSSGLGVPATPLTLHRESTLFAQLKQHPDDRQAQGYECQPHENDRQPGLKLFLNTLHTHALSRMPAKSSWNIRFGWWSQTRNP